VFLPYILLRKTQQELSKSKHRTWTDATHVYFSEMDQPLHVATEHAFENAMAFTDGSSGKDMRYVAPQRTDKAKTSSPGDVPPKGVTVVGQNHCAPK
jgi:hypothetical protein